MNYLKKSPMKKSLSVYEVQRIREKYPHKVPILVTETKNMKIDRQKFLVDLDMKYAELLLVFRRRLEDLRPSESIYMFVGQNMSLVPLHKSINETLDIAMEDDYIKITLAKENTFG
jgi:hypothetical protein